MRTWTRVATAGLLLATVACTGSPDPGPTADPFDGISWTQRLCDAVRPAEYEIDAAFARVDVPDEHVAAAGELAAELQAADHPSQELARRLTDPSGPLEQALADTPGCADAYVDTVDIDDYVDDYVSSLEDVDEYEVPFVDAFDMVTPPPPAGIELMYTYGDEVIDAQVTQPATGQDRCVQIDLDDGQVVSGPDDGPC